MLQVVLPLYSTTGKASLPVHNSQECPRIFTQYSFKHIMSVVLRVFYFDTNTSPFPIVGKWYSFILQEDERPLGSLVGGNRNSTLQIPKLYITRQCLSPNNLCAQTFALLQSAFPRITWNSAILLERKGFAVCINSLLHVQNIFMPSIYTTIRWFPGLLHENNLVRTLLTLTLTYFPFTHIVHGGNSR